MRITLLAAVAAACFVWTAWASTPPARPQRAGRSLLEQAREHAKESPNPFAEDANAVRAGKKLFGRYCAECHGDDGGGSQRAPSLRTRAMQEASPGQLFWVLTNGDLGGGMPAWSRLPEQQRWQLIRFLGTMTGQTEEPSAPPRTVEVYP